MSGGATPAISERADLAGSGGRRGRLRWVIVAVVLVLIAAGAFVAVSGVFDSGGGNSTGGNGSATSLATVERRSLSEQMQVNGTLGYSGFNAAVSPENYTLSLHDG